MLGHELRNPLGTMHTALELLNLPEADAATRQQAQEILHRQVRNMTRLIEDLLDLSRVLRPGELVQRGRTQFNYSSTTGWTTKSVTLGTALGKYAAAYCNMLHFGRALFASAGCYINQAYPVITGATSLTFQMYEFTNGSSAAFYTSWEVWPLKD